MMAGGGGLDGVRVLAEGSDWAVVAKPPRVLVHRNWRNATADALLQQVRDHYRRRVYPIHRLDYQASGCVLFGTEQEAAAPLQTALTGGRKQYLALVRGVFKHGSPIEVDKPMKDDNGILKEARSTVTCIGTCETPRCSLLLVEPHTGRYHQVRRHVRDLDHPIVGDRKHGDYRINKEWRDRGLGRLGLHALSLELDGDRAAAAFCPWFADMAAIIDPLPFADAARERFPVLREKPLPVPIIDVEEEGE
jgi:tRNA pseudouridine65 synthase